MKEVRSLTTTQERMPPHDHPLGNLVCFANTYPLDSNLSVTRIAFFEQLGFFPFFDQLCPVLMWSILNREICSNECIGSDNRDLFRPLTI